MQMQGEQIEEEDLKKAQEQAQAIEKDENIAELMAARTTNEPSIPRNQPNYC